MKKYEKGQALLVVILVMVVALTVGLSALVRTTSNLRTTSEDENSQRAFSAAEAGVERSLASKTSVPSTSFANNTSYQTSVNTVSGAKFNLNDGTVILKDDPVDVWFTDYPAIATSWTGNLTIDWGSSSDVCDPSESTNSQAALEIVLITGTKASPQVKTFAFDPCSTRAAVNKFQSPTFPGNTVSGKTYAYRTTVPVSSGLLLRIVPIYAPTFVAVEGDVSLPSQGNLVSAVGTSDTAQRKIVTFSGFPKLPTEIFPFSVFSPK